MNSQVGYFHAAFLSFIFGLQHAPTHMRMPRYRIVVLPIRLARMLLHFSHRLHIDNPGEANGSGVFGLTLGVRCISNERGRFDCCQYAPCEFGSIPPSGLFVLARGEDLRFAFTRGAVVQLHGSQSVVYG